MASTLILRIVALQIVNLVSARPRVSKLEFFVALALVALALAVVAKPLGRGTSTVTLPIVKHINSTGTLNLLAQDQARATWLKSRGGEEHSRKRAGGLPITNTAISYLAPVGIGSPATIC